MILQALLNIYHDFFRVIAVMIGFLVGFLGGIQIFIMTILVGFLEL